jgi:HPt (histidine-containing phosphotransfer) domain-containing protein
MKTTTNYTNLDYLRLMTGDDEEMIRTMVGMLLEELPEELEKTKTFYEAENWEDLKKVSHKMKSTMAFVGNEEMANANSEIEQRAKEMKDLDQIGGLIGIIESLMPHVLQELREIEA